MLRALIVEDDAAMRTNLKTVINWDKAGFIVEDEAFNGVEAVQKLTTQKFDLVLTVSQYGGTLLNKGDPGKAAFNSDAGVKALTFIKSLENEGLTNKPGADHVALFRQGKSLFCVDGIWSSTGMDAVQGLD